MKHCGTLSTLVLLVAVAGCDQGSASKAGPDVKAKSPQNEPTTPEEPATPPPRDIDVSALQDELECKPKSEGACAVLSAFSAAGEWKWQTPAGEGRWVGNAYTVDEGKEKQGFLLLWVKQVPTATVGAGMLPLKVGTGTLDEELGRERWKLVHAVASNSAVSRRNRAHPVAVAFVPQGKHGAQKSTGKSIAWFASPKGYLRQDGRKVLLVSPSTQPGHPKGEGLYAELWPVSW